MKLGQLIQEICRLDTIIRDVEEAELRKRCPGKIVVPMTAYIDLPRAPERETLRLLLHRQSPATLFWLLTLWRLGRRDFETGDDLLAEFLRAGDSFPNVHKAADYLMGKILPNYLESALRLFDDEGIDVDRLMA